eukprot:765903-Hanusia_phi.AAC.5
MPMSRGHGSRDTLSRKAGGRQDKTCPQTLDVQIPDRQHVWSFCGSCMLLASVGHFAPSKLLVLLKSMLSCRILTRGCVFVE